MAKKKKTTVEVAADLDKHEAVCAERWLETISRIKRLEAFCYSHFSYIIIKCWGHTS